MPELLSKCNLIQPDAGRTDLKIQPQEQMRVHAPYSSLSTCSVIRSEHACPALFVHSDEQEEVCLPIIQDFQYLRANAGIIARMSFYDLTNM